MATYKAGAVTIRISERDMQKAMQQVANRSAGGAAYRVADLSRRFIEQNNLEDKGRLKESITVSRGGALRGQGVVWRVTSLRSIAPHNNIIHGGRGSISSKKPMFLKKRRNDSRKSVLVRKTTFVKAVKAFPFLAFPAQKMREIDFAYTVSNGKGPTGKPLPKSETSTGGFTKFLNSGVTKRGKY